MNKQRQWTGFKKIRAQKDYPTRGYFVELVTEDLEKIQEDFDEDNFLKFSKINLEPHKKIYIGT